MFRQRLLAILLLAPLVLLAIYYANPWVFNALVCLLLIVCAAEWLQLIPISMPQLKLGFILLCLLATWLSGYVFYGCLVVGCFAWVFILMAVCYFPRMQRLWGRPWLVAGLCLVVLPLFARSLVAIYHQGQGKDLLVYLLLLVWATDIGAYLVGKLWGKHKLIPQVSPGKSIEGALGGLSLAMLVTWGAIYYFQPKIDGIYWFLMALATALMSMLGDLSISLFKRRVHLKDTGHLIPGHGGLLDRLDSLIAAAPLFYCGFYILATRL